MAQRTDPFQSKKHVCILALEREGGSFTGDLVCTICGQKLSSVNETSVKQDASPDNPRY